MGSSYYSRTATNLAGLVHSGEDRELLAEIDTLHGIFLDMADEQITLREQGFPRAAAFLWRTQGSDIKGDLDSSFTDFITRQEEAISRRVRDAGKEQNLALAAEPRTERGVVRYPITIRFEPPEGVEVPVALSGVSSVVLYEKKGVLSVPQGALHRTSKQINVRVMTDGVVEERAVILGDGDGSWVQVLQGLKEGDQVVVDTARAASTRVGLAMGNSGSSPPD